MIDTVHIDIGWNPIWVIFCFLLIFQTIYVIHPKINDLDRIQTCIYVNCTYQYYYYKYLQYDETNKQIYSEIEKVGNW